MCFLKGLTRLLLLFTGLLVFQQANAALVRFDYTGVINATSVNYSLGETFSGYYVVDSQAFGSQSTSVYSSGDRITTTTYRNPITDFQMVFADKTISFTPDGVFGSGGYDSIMSVRNDQRFTMSTGGYYYSDRLITTINDVSGSIGAVDLVQFDWHESSFTGIPELLSSSEIPLIATDYSVAYNQGRIFADGNQNIHFQLTSLEVVPVPLPAPALLLLSGLFGLMSVVKRKQRM